MKQISFVFRLWSPHEISLWICKYSKIWERGIQNLKLSGISILGKEKWEGISILLNSFPKTVCQDVLPPTICGLSASIWWPCPARLQGWAWLVRNEEKTDIRMHRQKAGFRWTELWWRNHGTQEARFVNYTELTGEVGLLHTAEQGGRVITNRFVRRAEQAAGWDALDRSSLCRGAVFRL